MKRQLLTNYLRYSATAGVIVMTLGSIGLAQQPGTTQAPQFVPFDQFMANTASAAFNSAAMPKVANAAGFAEMRQHIVSLYQSVHVTHSFMQGSLTLDCVPIEQQPSVRTLGLKGIAAPPSSSAKLLGAPAGASTLQQLGEAQVSSLLPASPVDQFGNATTCEDHTVPIQRTTIEQISRYPTLKAFLSKSPDGNTHIPVQQTSSSISTGALAASTTHKYATAYQRIYNLGGNSNLNLWSPYLFFTGELFSLSQVWYSGVSSTGADQTVEAGWQVSPLRFGGDQLAHLFVFYTPDGYVTGCYDHACSGFVQYSSSVFPGATFPSYSQYQGPQFEASIFWEMWAGNWWLSVSGQWIGYYPGRLYGTGEMATHSTLIEYGGEVAVDPSYHIYPPMGSGRFAETGYQSAAYQKNISYLDSFLNSQLASLTVNPNGTLQAGYTFSGPSAWGPWGIYFFFGGPGCYQC
jgi:hypothetical protein